MSKYTRLGKNTALVFIGNAGAKLIGLLMLPFYTRWLSVEDYGTTDIINVYVSLLLGLTTACIAEAVFIFPKDQSYEKQKSYFSSGLCFAFCTLLITAFLFKIVTFIFVYRNIQNSFTSNVSLVYGLLATTFLQQYIQQFVRSIDKMKVYSTTGIVLTTCTALLSFLIIPRYGVFGYVFALIFANLTAAVYSFLTSGAFKYMSAKAVQKTISIEMLKYSVPLIPNGIMWWLVGALNRPLMENQLGMHAVGIFGVANKFPGILSMLFTMFAVSWQISVLEEFGKEGYTLFFNKMFRAMITGSMLLFFIIAISSKLIVSIFTTSSFYEAWRYVPVLTLGVLFSSISGFAGNNFSATREGKYFFYSSVWGAGAALLGNFILIPRFGIMGAAASVPISFAVMAVSRVLYGWKYVKIQNIKRYLLMLLMGVGTIFILLYMQTAWLRYSSLGFVCILFIVINYDAKNDAVKLFRMVKAKL